MLGSTVATYLKQCPRKKEETTPRSPSGALLPTFFGGRVPLLK